MEEAITIQINSGPLNNQIVPQEIQPSDLICWLGCKTTEVIKWHEILNTISFVS